MNDGVQEQEQGQGQGRYPIRVVARLTGIPIDTLRAWERRYQVVEPARDDRGRLYDDVDLRKLKLLKRLVERGHAIGRIARRSEADLERLAEAGLEERDRDGQADAVDIRALLHSVDRYDSAGLDRALGKLAAVLSAREMVLEVILPFMRAVGQGWIEGRFSVAQEHIASASVRVIVASLIRVLAPRDGGPGVVLATTPGERHEIGLLAAAILAAGAGLSVTYLGADLPGSDIAAAVRRTGARAVVLAATGCDGAPPPGGAVRGVVDGVPPGVDVLVGGPAAEARPEEIREAGGRFVRSLDALEQVFRSLAA